MKHSSNSTKTTIVDNDFNIWNEKKKQINKTENHPHFFTAQIWWVQFGKNIVTEITGKGADFLRPAIILQKVYKNACLVIPLTSQQKNGDYYFNFCDSSGKKQCAKLVQIRYIDARRLKYKLSNISAKDFENLKYDFMNIIKK